MGKQRLAKYQARQLMSLEARRGINKMGRSKSTAPRTNYYGCKRRGGDTIAVQRANVVGFIVNSKGSSVIGSRLYRDPNYDAIEQVSDLLMPSEAVPPNIAQARRAKRAITPEFGRGAPSLFDACTLIESKNGAGTAMPSDPLRGWLYRFTPEPGMQHERFSPRYEGRNRWVYSANTHLPMYPIARIVYHKPEGTLPPIAYTDTRAAERDRLSDYLSLYHLARTEAAQAVSEHWPWPVDWANGAPSIN